MPQIKSIVLDPELHARFKVKAAQRRIKLIDAAKDAIEMWMRNGNKKAA